MREERKRETSSRVPQAKWLMPAPGPHAKVAASHWASRESGASANV